MRPPLQIKDAKRSAKITKHFVEKHCRSDVSEEWTPVDDRKIAKLRGILAALQEENQSTQLLKKESENQIAKKELEATRSSVDLRLAVCKEKDSLFQKKQLELRQHVQDNEKSLLELETNIDKGEKKMKDEISECKSLEKEIRTLDAELKEQEVVKEAELNKIAQTNRFKKFLEAAVQEQEEDFEGDIEVLMKRHNRLVAANLELHQTNKAETTRLDLMREECQRVQAEMQNKHLMISSQLHKSQVNLDRIRAECQEWDAKLNRALEEKELKESQVGVIQMAIEQLFSRTVVSCRLKQRKKAMYDFVDIKFAPVRGDKSDVKLEEMLKQIVERMEDLKEIKDAAAGVLKPEVVRQVHVLDEAEFKVEYVHPHQHQQRQQRDDGTSKDTSSHGHDSLDGGQHASSSLRGAPLQRGDTSGTGTSGGL